MTPQEFVEKHGRLFAPSGSSRWIFCPGSVQMELAMRKKHPDKKELPSIYAAQGTAAHTLAARCVKDDVSPHNFIGETIDPDDGSRQLFKVDIEMANAVAIYADYVLGFAKQDFDPIMEVEETLDLTHISPYVHSGTSDAWVYQKLDKHLHVFDFKYGSGVFVEVENNTQLLIYGMGVAHKLALHYHIQPYEIKNVTLHIVQPRANNGNNPPHAWQIQPALLNWVHELILKAIRQSFSESPPFSPSESRCRWCPGSGECVAEAELNISRARADFGHLVNYEAAQETASPVAGIMDNVPEPTFPDVATLSKFELSVILKWQNAIQAFLSRVGDRALGLQREGDRIPNFKLVRGRSVRKWKDEASAIKTLRSLALDDDEIWNPPKMKSPSQIEKVLKTKKVDKAPIEDQIEKPRGELKLAPLTDKRPEVDPQTLPHHDFAEFKT